MTDEIKSISNFDRLIHEPSRLAIMAVLFASTNADFKYLLNTTGLSKGNLSAHLRKLEEGGYLTITKGFKGNYPHTTCALTREGRKAFKDYQKQYLSLAKQFENEGHKQEE
ncbi:MAG: transcriptional regulator [Anaerolineales bacterium]|jgi:DNA-binding MarR family transcriptional regulator